MGPVPLSLAVTIERWPIAGAFTISRGAKTEAAVVIAELSDGTRRGRGECVPYARYGESVAGVADAIRSLSPALARGLTREQLQQALPPGAARNALDCAFWDLAAKREGRPAHALAGLPEPKPLVTAYTISLGSAETMAQAAAAAAARPLLKVKLGGEDDRAAIAAVRRAGNLAACAEAGVTLIEQPLPAGDDAALAQMRRPLPVCADESVHGLASLAALVGKYDAVNVKLDKTGGLTEALAMAAEAERLGFAVMVGCMVATSLAMAPAVLLAQGARVVDLDGPLLLARDRPHGLIYDGSLVYPPSPTLWG
jgi:L-alanine-DL-glutamate epimerase-like enolase superfamily enzyme